SLIRDDPAINPPTVEVHGHGTYKDAEEASWDLSKSRRDAAYDALMAAGASPEQAHAVLNQPKQLDPPAMLGAEDKRPELSQKDGKAIFAEHRRRQEENRQYLAAIQHNQRMGSMTAQELDDEATARFPELNGPKEEMEARVAELAKRDPGRYAEYKEYVSRY